MDSLEHGRVVDSNPFVDIATHLFLEDLASKVGVAGLNNYLISLANNLAANMPEEEYETVTKHCLVTRRSPFERGWREYAKRVGAFSKVHREVAEYYNSKVKSTAVNSLHIILHSFRDAASKRIRVGGKPLKYEQIATVWVDGERKVAGDDRLNGLLKKAGISRTRLGMLLRNNADVWLLAPE